MSQRLDSGRKLTQHDLLDRLVSYFANPSNDDPKPILHPDQSINRLSRAPDMKGRGFRNAAVLIPIIKSATGSASTVVFTVRTEHLSSHAGQISLPGGTEDAVDVDPVDTALRESEEEIGLQRDSVQILGRLGQMLLPTGYCITPVVGLITPGTSFQASPQEVAEIFEAPLELILNPASYRWAKATFPNGNGTTIERCIVEVHHEAYRIWGATAAILHHLANELMA